MIDLRFLPKRRQADRPAGAPVRLRNGIKRVCTYQGVNTAHSGSTLAIQAFAARLPEKESRKLFLLSLLNRTARIG
jgi:hypothetical protein